MVHGPRKLDRAPKAAAAVVVLDFRARYSQLFSMETQQAHKNEVSMMLARNWFMAFG